MRLEFKDKKDKKERMIGIRLSKEKYEKVERVGKKNDASISETGRVLLEAALREIK